MSKIEEALEKASKLRNKGTSSEKSRQVVNHEIDLGKINNDCLLTLTEPDSLISEEYRRIKSMIIRETKSNFLNTLMITSSIESEGKTLTSINIAVTMAQEIDHSILLIDADLRKPKTHEYLGVRYKHGLSDYLKGEVDISDILIKTGIGNLILIPAGRAVSNPVELLSSDRMKTLVHELKHRYIDRYVIIDTPPILPFADAIAVGSLVDGVVFIVREGRTQKKAIEDSLNLIKNLNVLGIVFNRVREANLNGHHYRYYNYYSYGKQKEKSGVEERGIEE